MFTTDSGSVSDVSLEVKVKLISAEGRVQLNLEKGVEIDHVIRVIFGTGVVVFFVHGTPSEVASSFFRFTIMVFCKIFTQD